MFLGRSLRVSRISGRSGCSSGRGRNSIRSQSKGNVTVRGVFPRPATLFLGEGGRWGRAVVSDGERVRLLLRGERKTSGGRRHDVGGGGIRADHGGVSRSVRCGPHHHGWWWWWWRWAGIHFGECGLVGSERIAFDWCDRVGGVSFSFWVLCVREKEKQEKEKRERKRESA